MNANRQAPLLYQANLKPRQQKPRSKVTRSTAAEREAYYDRVLHALSDLVTFSDSFARSDAYSLLAEIRNSRK